MHFLVSGVCFLNGNYNLPNFCFRVFLEYFSKFFLGDALYALRLALNASPAQLSDWNQNQVNPCTWSSVNCDDNSNVVSV